MKTYKKLISEVGLSDFIPDTLRKFRKTTRSLDRRYPGVNQFLSVANKWVFKAQKFENRDLKKLLKRMRRRPDISDMSKTDIMKIYKFVEKYELHSLSAVRHVFAKYRDFTKRTNDDIEA